MPTTKHSTKRRQEEEDATEPVLTETAAQRAKRAFLTKQSEPSEPVKYSSGGAGSVTIEAIVTRASKIMVSGKKGMAPMMRMNFFAIRVSAGNSTVVTTNIDGVAFGLPTKQMEASPDQLAKDPNAKGPVLIEIDIDHKTGYLGQFSASFFMDQGKPGAKDDSSSVELCVPGNRVEITGVSCAFGKNGDALYTNARKIVPLLSPPSPCDTAKAMISEFSHARVQSTAAFMLSQTMNGFFGVTYAEGALTEQTAVCKQLWESFVTSSASKCDAIAASFAGDADRNEAADAMVAQAAFVRAISPPEAASGTLLFNTPLGKDLVTPYAAPVVQKGLAPGAVAGQMCCDLFDPSKASSLPSSFVEGRVDGINFRGNLVQIGYRLNFVFDSAAAIKVINCETEAGNPVLDTCKAAVSVKLSKRSLGPEMMGSLVDSKVEMGVTQLFPFMDQVAVASIYPRDPSHANVDGHFCSGLGFDMVDGIQKAGVQISIEFLDAEMLGKRGVHIYSAPEDAAMIEPATGVGPSPTLSKSGYQALSEGSFEVDSLKPPADSEKTVQFFVVYNKCLEDVTAKPELATSVDAGETHLRDVAAVAREDGDLKAFLKLDCLVYAVAV